MKTYRSDEAEALYREALAITTRSSGADHPKVAIRMDNLGRCLRAKQKPGEVSMAELVEAEQLHRSAWTIGLKTFDPDHWEIAESREDLAQVLDLMGRPNDAADARNGIGP